MGFEVRYEAPGKVSARFLTDRTFIHGIIGPNGSAKTTTALMKFFYIACEQRPSPVDGVRYTRFVVIRDTYRQMARSTLKSWHKRVPKDMGRYQDGGQNGQTTHHLRLQVPGVGIIDMEVIFAAIGDNDVEDFCRGFEPTAAYVNEADRCAREVITHLSGRCGRYPDALHGGCSWYGLWFDMNAPDVDHWAYEDIYDPATRLPGYSVHIQPGGRTPEAENVPNLPPGYYDPRNRPDWWVRRFIDNLPGYSRAGKPVYEHEYHDQIHVASEIIVPRRYVPLYIGLDQGLFPSAIITQRLPQTGQRLVLAELVMENVGYKTFAAALNRLLASERFRGIPVEKAFADPAGLARSAASEEGGEAQHWAALVARECRLKVVGAPSNAPGVRQEAVRQELGTVAMDDPHRRNMLIDPVHCPMLRRGFNSGYHYRKRRASDGDSYEPTVNKNKFSNPHDALQYVVLGDGGYDLVSKKNGTYDRRDDDDHRPRQGRRPGRAQSSDYNPLNDF